MLLAAPGTHFTNPNGLFDEDHYTTARDLANITRTAMKNKTFSRIVAAKEWNADRPGSTYRHFVNKNKTVRQFDGGNGVKIGYTKASGANPCGFCYPRWKERHLCCHECAQLVPGCLPADGIRF